MQHKQVIAVTGGKGGVGKSVLSVNLSVCLAKLGQKVVLFDADFGLSNVDMMLGLTPKFSIQNVLDGEVSIREALVNGPVGMKILPGLSGSQPLSNLSQHVHRSIIHAFDEIYEDVDTLIVDTAAGLSDMVIDYSVASHSVLVVVCDEPTSIADAYAIIKVLNQNYQVKQFKVVANMVRSSGEGARLFKKIQSVTDRFLDIQLDYVGQVPYDLQVRESIKKRESLCQYAPNSRAVKAIESVARSLVKHNKEAEAAGHVQFFMEPLLKERALAY